VRNFQSCLPQAFPHKTVDALYDLSPPLESFFFPGDPPRRKGDDRIPPFFFKGVFLPYPLSRKTSFQLLQDSFPLYPLRKGPLSFRKHFPPKYPVFPLVGAHFRLDQKAERALFFSFPKSLVIILPYRTFLYSPTASFPPLTL